MTTTWDVASKWIIPIEGGYVNDPHDPGGETKFGISKRAYPHIDIKNLTPDQALALYRSDYYQKAACHLVETFAPALALVVFDCAVLQGATEALKLLQRRVGVVQDGVVGPNTINALRLALSSPERGWMATLEYLLDRIDEMDEIPPARFYLVGWCARMDKLRVEARSLYLTRSQAA